MTIDVNLANLKGEQFGRLTVLSYKVGPMGGVKCQCECECGESVEFTHYQLKNKIYTSCGCASKKRGKVAKPEYIHPVKAMLNKPDHLRRNHPMLPARRG
jgi:hypothetical protein